MTHDRRGFLVVAGTATAAHDRKVANELGSEPVAGFSPEGFVLGAEAKVHGNAILIGSAAQPSIGRLAYPQAGVIRS